MSTKNFSPSGPDFWPAIGKIYIYECLALLYRLLVNTVQLPIITIRIVHLWLVTKLEIKFNEFELSITGSNLNSTSNSSLILNFESLVQILTGSWYFSDVA